MKCQAYKNKEGKVWGPEDFSVSRCKNNAVIEITDVCRLYCCEQCTDAFSRIHGTDKTKYKWIDDGGDYTPNKNLFPTTKYSPVVDLMETTDPIGAFLKGKDVFQLAAGIGVHVDDSRPKGLESMRIRNMIRKLYKSGDILISDNKLIRV